MSEAAGEVDYLVVVGLGQSGSAVALQWAMTAATARGGRVRAVRAWRPTPATAGARGAPSQVARGTAAQEEAEERRRLADDVAGVLGDNHGVELVLVNGGRRKVLVAESAHADLLVVDAPNLTSLSNSPLQVQRLVTQSACPVVVMPKRVTGEPDTWLARATKSVAWAVVRGAGRSGRPGVRPPSIATDKLGPEDT